MHDTPWRLLADDELRSRLRHRLDGRPREIEHLIDNLITHRDEPAIDAELAELFDSDDVFIERPPPETTSFLD